METWHFCCLPPEEEVDVLLNFGPGSGGRRCHLCDILQPGTLSFLSAFDRPTEDGDRPYEMGDQSAA